MKMASDKTLLLVVEAIKNFGPMTSDEVANIIGRSITIVDKAIRILRDSGDLFVYLNVKRQLGPGRNYYAVAGYSEVFVPMEPPRNLVGERDWLQSAFFGTKEKKK